MAVSAHVVAIVVQVLCIIVLHVAHADNPEIESTRNPPFLRDDEGNQIRQANRRGLGEPLVSTNYLSTRGSRSAADSTPRPLNSSVVINTTTTTTTRRKDFCDPTRFFQCRSGQCITRSFRCDGQSDCQDKSDEEGCLTLEDEEDSKCPRPRQFFCQIEEICIPQLWVCDGKPDCNDASDEANCTSPTCQPHQYRCHGDGKCISNTFLCNGEKDCFHGDDEEDCGKTLCEQTPGHFQCKSGDCVPPETVCDGHEDCADGSDEGGSCNNTCQEGQCSHKCFMTPRGPHCTCQDGYIINPDDERNCEDVDECESDRLVCDHYCHNVPGTFLCSCNPKYLLQPDNVTCRSKEINTAFLLVAQDSGIRSINLDSYNYNQIYAANDTFIGVAYDPLDLMVYWSTPSGIFSDPLGPNVLPNFIIQQGVSQAEGLAVDWVGRNLYLTDFHHQHILVCRLDGVDCHVLIENISHPRAIQLDILHRYMYWTDIKDSVIERAGMDGSNRRIFVSEGLYWPNALALDQPAERLYWLDAFHDTAYSISTDGFKRKHLAEAIVNHPYALAVWEEHLYWSDWNNIRIQTCIKRDGRHVETVLKGSTEHRYFGISLYHPAMFNQGPNPCGSSRCSHLCLLSPTSPSGYTCVCPTGTMVLSSDHHTCQDVENRTYPLVANGSWIYVMSTRLYGRSTVTPWNTPSYLHTVGDLDYDPSLETVVVSDTWKETIIGISLATGISRVIANNTRAVGLAVDWLRNNIYWVDGKETVEVARLVEGTTQYRLQVVQQLQDPMDIALAPLLGYLYVSGAGLHPYIMRCGLDGKMCTNIVYKDLKKPLSLAFDRDPDIKRLYWSDLEMRRIESVAEDGSDRRLMLVTYGRPLSVLVHGMHMMWSLENQDFIFMAPKINMTTASEVSLGVQRSDRERLKLSEMGWKVPARVTAIGHPCSQANGNCSQLCLSNSLTEKVCACQTGYQLQADGVNCDVFTLPDHLFQCTNSNSYVPTSWRCDGSRDCDDGSDEDHCEVEPKECEEGYFQCRISGNCITNFWKCDGAHDCEDGSDEDLKECQNVTCGSSQWQCGSGECIPRMWHCDHRPECKDGSDEVNCSTTCPSYKFTCRDGRCIPAMWRCDEGRDCEDGSDEDNCQRECEDDEFTCGNNQCVPKTAVCDGFNNCDDGTDEEQSSCTEQPIRSPNCSKGQISCRLSTSMSGPRCIPEEAVCNGYKDCPLGEDEDCYDCPHNQHRCLGSDTCIPIRFLCDGKDDCGDGSDESASANCSKTTATSAASTTTSAPMSPPVAPRSRCDGFRCKIGDCVDDKKVCDGVSDCLDGSDEGYMCETTCIKNGGCQHECRSHPHGRYCSCHAGFILADDGRNCLNYNECEEERRCGHICLDIKGSYMCTCLPGYALLPDGATCKPEAGEEWAMLAVPGSLVNISHAYHVMGMTTVPTSIAMDSIAFVQKKKRLLYTDKTQGIVGLMAMDNKTGVGMEVKTIISQRSNPQGLSFDPKTANVYFSEFFGAHPLQENGRVERDATDGDNGTREHSVIMVCGMDSKKCSLVYRTVNEVIPSTNVAVNERKLIYCTNSLGSEDQGEIVTSLLDGCGREVIWMNKVVRCGSVVADEGKGRVYWTDISLNTVETVTWRGTHHRVVQKHQVHSPVGLTLTGDWVMWINKGGHDLVRCKKYNSNVCERKPLPSSAQAVYVTSPVIYDEPDECDSAECEHLCTSHNKEAKCMCPVGLQASQEQPGKCVELTGCAGNPCQVGGVCEPHSDEDYICRCRAGQRGLRCEVGVEEVVPPSSGSSAVLTVILLMVIIVLVAVGVCWYKKRPFTIWKSKRGSQVFRFVNPAFGVMRDQAIVNNSSTSDSSPPNKNHDPVSANSNFENPFFKHEENQANTSMDSAVASATDSSTSINIPSHQVDLSSPLMPQMQQPPFGEKQKPEWAFSPYNPLAV